MFDALLSERLEQAGELRALIRGQPPSVAEALGQAGRRRRVRDFDDAHALADRECDRGLAGGERADDRQRLVVLRELLRAGRRLLGIAAGVELDQLDLLAADAALGVDLVNGDVHRCLRGFADGLEDAGHHGVQSDDDLLCARRASPRIQPARRRRRDQHAELSHDLSSSCPFSVLQNPGQWVCPR